MELYKEYQINPFSGCLPILIQMPIFINFSCIMLLETLYSDATFLWFNLKSPDRFISL